MAHILILFSTTDGHTVKICKHLQGTLEQGGHQVSLQSLHEAGPISSERFDKIVLGASIRYGKHSPKVYAFIRQHHELLERIPSAFFSVNLVARKAEKRTAQTNPYVRKFLSQIPWKPQETAVFAGMLDYPKYGRFDRCMIRFIMWMTKGPTDPSTRIEFTDWDQVNAFAQKIDDL